MSRILLTGVNGQVGYELAIALAPLGDLHTATRAEFDLSDPTAMLAALARLRPDVIVNPAAYTAVDRAESDQATAMQINAEAPGVLARWAVEHGALLVHYSTDYVFDGLQTEPYRETDPIDPQSVYGRSKWLGEESVRQAGGRHLIFRTSWVFGRHGANFLKTMLRLAGERDTLRVVADQFGAPTSAALIAAATADIVRQYLANPETTPLGTYHLTARGRTNWCDYARYIIAGARARGMALKVRDIEAIGTADYPLPAPRPANSSLDCRKLKQDFGFALPPWQQGVDQVLDQLLGV
ncbi:dTDP-4-dehydrorhamnose reductase [Paludibacterium purpuratum]|uniref:dTDP-4-dehydrorhamnose reductase n=1 Tax=Paludibacterium purpuratum TaxID=1144873 RepID=A0A4R7B181_9NEIS|nr:dTDP-4-dehydrorhamnose reductase [Paludibacterium purpuratum]TDR76708.1 dTDP-4-dehydrorhamnose reductase [Paludibacterium purpuratum]